MYENINALQNRTIIVNGYATAAMTAEQLSQWAENLTYVSYYSYGFNFDSSLVPIDDLDLINYAYQSGVAPLMVLTPFNAAGEYSYGLVKEVFENPVMRDNLINEIYLTVTRKNYYGVVFNFGFIDEEDREQFVITVSKTTARLNREGKLVIVSLVPGINDAGIDYESLGKAANFVELRTFSFEQGQMPPSAISPIDRIRNMLSMIGAEIDPTNILLGLPNYAFDWTLPFVQGRTAAEIVSNTEATERAERVGAAIQYNETLHSPFYVYTDVSGAEHIVWYEDERSIRVKLEAVNEFNLAGVSIWTIMNPFPAGIVAINELYTVLKVL